jgi:hypothetical protein
MNRRYKHFPVITYAGGVFYLSFMFFNTPAIMMLIMFLSFALVYVPTGSVRLALFSPVVFLIGVVTGMKPFIDKEKSVLILTHRDYVLDAQYQQKKQLFGILMLE